MKRQLDLWRTMANELAIICHTSASRDFETVSARVAKEGISFMTITLPSFGKEFEKALDAKKASDVAFLGFKKRAGLPLFLGGFLRNVFDDTGVIRDGDITDSVYAVRQLCGLFGKVELECSEERRVSAFHGYISTDDEVTGWDKTNAESLDDFSRIAHLLFASSLGEMENLIYSNELTPRHGPGATADRLSGNAKFDLSYWPQRLDAAFSYYDYAVPNAKFALQADRVNFYPEEREIPARVLFVPKTLKTPRVIAAEPTALQYIQQGIMRELVPRLEGSYIGSMIGFSDQNPNKELARLGSQGVGLATLDMSEASDRVSLLQALALGKNFPWFRKALVATRSQLAELTHPVTGRKTIHKIGKFASMGSALCFPVEGMAFLTAIFLGIERKLIREGSRTQLTREDVKSFNGLVRVYGDDIIVPIDCVSDVIDIFQSLGWKTNVDKSFWNGDFRESCGGDYFRGEDVTIIRYRRWSPSSHRDAAFASSIVAFRNQLYWRGMWRTARYLDEGISRYLSGHYPVVSGTSELLGRESALSGALIDRAWKSKDVPRVKLNRNWNPVSRGWVTRSRIRKNSCSEVGALLKCLISPSQDEEHLLYSGRSSSVDMNLRWKSIA